MSVDSPLALLSSLVAVTLLGIIMGYCLGLLRSKRRARQAIQTARQELAKSRSTVEVDLGSARAVIVDQRQALAMERERTQKALKRESALELHSQLQAQRIQTLESQVRSYEDQQIRLKRDFASYKSNKSRELELAKNKPDAWSSANELPVLQKRIVDPAVRRNRQASVHAIDTSRNEQEQLARSTQRSGRGLSSPLSRELEIPALSESELPDSVEDLDFELLDQDANGEVTRG
ncbi:hypothetical protein ACUNV4_01675 [Granulosicoccus sp. 3-233]|uniref:hypothetical protein n=1 Tax=Granulosicoccus sp. 3-233 TaxID=3417969 RepID=UPI003D33F2F5